MPEPATDRAAADRPEGDGPPVFIVGTSRSGTSMLASIVGSHPLIACGPETALFLHLGDHRGRIVEDPAWPDRAVAFLAGLQRETATDPVLAHYDLTPDQARSFLAARSPSVRALMEALTVPFMRAHGKVRWAEKTPKHLYHLRQIRREWPDARIVRIVRDPRGAALSSRVPPFEWSATRVAYHWRMDEAAWQAFAATDPHTHSLRYEDLVRDPSPVLRHLCTFLGVPFPDDMAAGPTLDQTVIPEQEPWHALVGQPLDPARADAWRHDLSPDDQAIVAVVAGREMRRLGYEGGVVPRSTIALHPWVPRIVRVEDDLAALAREGVVAGPPPRSWRAPRRLVVVGLPGQLWWTKGAARPRRALLAWTGRLVAARLRGRPVLWVPVDLDRPGHDHRLDRLADRLLSLLARRVSPGHVAAELAP